MGESPQDVFFLLHYFLDHRSLAHLFVHSFVAKIATDREMLLAESEKSGEAKLPRQNNQNLARFL